MTRTPASDSYGHLSEFQVIAPPAGDELGALWQGAFDHPEEWDRYLIIADYYDDQGRPDEAEAVRWAGTNHKRPWYDSDTNGPLPWGKRHWFATPLIQDTCERIDSESDLPLEVFARLANSRPSSDLAAWGSFVRAFIKARKDGWRP